MLMYYSAYTYQKCIFLKKRIKKTKYIKKSKNLQDILQFYISFKNQISIKSYTLSFI